MHLSCSAAIARRSTINKYEDGSHFIILFHDRAVTSGSGQASAGFRKHATVDAYDDPPTSLAICLYTLFRKSVNKIMAGLAYDTQSTPEQCLVATTLMAMKCGVSVEKLCSAVYAMSKSLVSETMRRCKYVKSLRPMGITLTQYGYEVAFANKGRTGVDHESLKEVMRLIGSR